MKAITWVSACVLAIHTAGCATASSGSGGKKELTNTERARLYVEIANGALVEGDPTGAMQSLVEAQRLDDSLPELHHSKALAYFGKKDLTHAIAEARRALELRPDYVDAQSTLGKLLVDAGAYDEATTYLTQAATNPTYRDSYKAWINLGIIAYRRNQFAKSEEAFDRAIETSPVNACIAYYYRGNLALRDRKFDEAIGHYEHATGRFCAGFADAQLALGIAYEQGRQYTKARKKYLEIQQRYPNSRVADQAVDHLKYLP